MAISKKFNGLREYTGEEISAIFMGQGGMDYETSGTAVEAGVTAGYQDVKRWCIIHCLEAGAIEARSEADGDDLTTAVSGVASAFTNTNHVSIAATDTIVGAFDKFRIQSGKFLLYRG